MSLRKLERAQERALRAVFLDKQSSYQALLDKSDLTTLQNRRLQDIAILMYKVKHKLCPIKISELFHAHCSPYNLRTAEFAIPRFRTNKYGKHSLTYLGPKMWNKLPSKIRTLPLWLPSKVVPGIRRSFVVIHKKKRKT